MIQPDPTYSTIVRGPETESYHLNTHNDIECVNCYENFFFGQHLQEVIFVMHNFDCFIKSYNF